MMSCITEQKKEHYEGKYKLQGHTLHEISAILNKREAYDSTEEAEEFLSEENKKRNY